MHFFVSRIPPKEQYRPDPILFSQFLAVFHQFIALGKLISLIF